MADSETGLNQATARPTRLLLIVSFVQGLCLFFLNRSFETETWPSTAPAWSFPLCALATLSPIMYLLSATRENLLTAARYVGAYSVVLALLAAYVGYQATPHDAFPVGSLGFAFALTISIASFKALMYLQQRANQEPLNYSVLFVNSWRNFLVGVLAGLFTLIFWLILLLWGGLFKVIGIDFFYELFTDDWFAIPINTVAFGVGILLFRNLTRVIDSITQLLHWLTKLLLPLLIALAVCFLAALPFSGLDLLWSTGNGTGLLLWLLALILFFLNTVYQDGRERDPYPTFLDRAIYIGVCVTPLLAALAFYGLLLRLQQYGWSNERCWAFAVWLMLSLFSIGYVIGIVRRRDAWTEELARINTGMGFVVLGILLLANSPLLDFRKISLESQLERVASGAIELTDFDFWYAKNRLARPGHLALQDMIAEIGDSDPELLARIENPTRYFAEQTVADAAAEQTVADAAAVWDQMIYRPAGLTVPEELRPILEQRFYYMEDAQPVLIEAELGGYNSDDNSPEYILLSVYDSNSLGATLFFYFADNRWQTNYINFSNKNADEPYRIESELILNGEISIQPPVFQNIEIGSVKFYPQPEHSP